MDKISIAKELADRINRPYADSIWKSRADSSVEESIVRLFQKFNFELFHLYKLYEITEKPYEINLSDSFQVIEGAYRTNLPLTSSSEYYPLSIIDSGTASIDIRNIAGYEIPPRSIIKAGMRLLAGSEGAYMIEGYLNKKAAELEENFELEFLPQCKDFIIYDGTVRLKTLLNEDVNQIAIARELRDEAYNDIINWNDKFTLKGAIDLIG